MASDSLRLEKVPEITALFPGAVVASAVPIDPSQLELRDATPQTLSP